jgi:hypothetical protein
MRFHGISFSGRPADLPVRFCFRGLDVPAPAYDLSRRLSEDAARTLPVFETGAVTPSGNISVRAAFAVLSVAYRQRVRYIPGSFLEVLLTGAFE